eukprot:gene40165-48945_t
MGTVESKVVVVWRRDGREFPFEVEWKKDMSIMGLRESISDKRIALRYSEATVTHVYAVGDQPLDNDNIVPAPVKGGVGWNATTAYRTKFLRKGRTTFEAAQLVEATWASASQFFKKRQVDADKTPCGYFRGIIEGLEGKGDYVVFENIHDQEAFLTENQVAAAEAALSVGRHEQFLVAFMTPLLVEKLLSKFPASLGLKLVNSEEYSWVPQSANVVANYLAPDQFVCPHYLIKFMPPSNTRDSLILIADAKKKLDDKGQGEFMKYLEQISFVPETQTALEEYGRKTASHAWASWEERFAALGKLWGGAEM